MRAESRCALTIHALLKRVLSYTEGWRSTKHGLTKNEFTHDVANVNSRCTSVKDVLNHGLRVHLAVMAHMLFRCNGMRNERTNERTDELKNRRGL